MGRSVSYPSNAVVVFEHYEGESWFWEHYVEGIVDQICDRWPSVRGVNYFLGCENRVIAENQHACFGVSEYCGLVSIWVVPRSDECNDWGEPVGLSAHWVDQISERFKAEFGSMLRSGSMSNGQGVYVAKPGAEEPAEDVSGDSGHVVINGMLCG